MASSKAGKNSKDTTFCCGNACSELISYVHEINDVGNDSRLFLIHDLKDTSSSSVAREWCGYVITMSNNRFVAMVQKYREVYWTCGIVTSVRRDCEVLARVC